MNPATSLAVVAWSLLATEPGGTAFAATWTVDPLARVLKLFAVLAVATVFLYSRPYLRDRGLHHGEYYLLGLFALLGIFVLCSARWRCTRWWPSTATRRSRPSRP